MADLNVLKKAVMEIQEERALSLTKQYLEEGADPLLVVVGRPEPGVGLPLRSLPSPFHQLEGFRNSLSILFTKKVPSAGNNELFHSRELVSFLIALTGELAFCQKFLPVNLGHF